MTSLIVGGALANKYGNGGAAWTRLSWILGLRKLGFRVYFVEQLDECSEESGGAVSFRYSPAACYFMKVTESFGLSDSSALIYRNGKEIIGPSRTQLVAWFEDAAALINITGHLSCSWLYPRARKKVYIDLDPGYTQVWQSDRALGAHLFTHDQFFTVGANVGTLECSVPVDGISWRPIRQPVVLEDWPRVFQGDPSRFTTVGSWRGPYGPLEYQGRRYGLKCHEFRKFLKLPGLCRDSRFELALDIHGADIRDLELLRRCGWRVRHARQAIPEPEEFRRFVQTSGAEFSVAQGVYVETRSGWFSDRTVRYLASGKPVLVQETGFARELPVGEGLLSFSTLQEAREGVSRIQSDYVHHCHAARWLAEEFFDSDRVLGDLVGQIGVAP